MRFAGLTLVALCSAFTLPLAAQDADGDDTALGRSTAEQSTASGVFLRFTESPNMQGHKVAIDNHVGGDSNRRGAVVETRGEAVLYARKGFGLGLIGGGSYVGATQRFPEQSSAFGGVKLQALSQRQHGVDGGVAVSYVSRGFNLVPTVAADLMLARAFGDTQVLLNLTYGAGLEDAERYGALRAALLTRVAGQLRVGVEARFMSDLERAWEEPEGEPEFEGNGGAVVSYAISHVSLSAMAGPAALRYRDGVGETLLGATFTVGVGATL